MGVAGRASGAREGSWRLSVIESADLDEDRIRPRGGQLRTIAVEQTAWAEKQLLKPFDLLVTARSRNVKLALVPPHVSRTVASATLLVVRSAQPSGGLSHFLWYYLTSGAGRAQVESQITQGVTIPTLSVSALGSIQVPLPDHERLRAFAHLVDAATAARDTALETVRLRHDLVRDAVVSAITRESWEAT